MTVYFRGIQAGISGVHGESEDWNYIFRSDDHRDTVQDVVRHRMCPYIGQQHPEVRFLWLKPGGLRIQQDSTHWSKWTVTASWTKLEPGEEPPERENPNKPSTEQPDFEPSVTIHFEEYTAPLEFAFTTEEAGSGTPTINRMPIVNSALEPYDPPPEVPRLNPLIRVQRNLLITDALWKQVNELNNTVDTRGFTFKRGAYALTVGPYESRFKFEIGEKLEYTDEKGKKKSYASLTLQVIVNRLTWKIALLDAGSYFLSQANKTIATRLVDDDWSLSGGTTKKPFLDLDKNPKIGLLNGQGEQLTSGSVFNEYQGFVYTSKHGDFFKRITRGE